MTKITSGTREWCDSNINIYSGCSNDCVYCVDQNIEILMADLTEKPIKNIKIGDLIIGIKWNEKNHPKFIKSQVLNKWNIIKKAIKIELEDNKYLICSKNHRWYSNRGWKYTVGSMGGKNQRPYLTINNSLPFLRSKNQTNLEETIDYKKGYLSGMIKGDAHLKKHNTKTGYSYQFRLALIDDEPLIICQKYLREFGVKTKWFEFNDKMNGIRTNKEVNIARIQFIIKNINNSEFLRGFIAGIFDAEGSNYKNVLSISNTDSSIISTIKYGLKLFNFDFRVRESKREYNNVIYIRIRGGYQETIKFFQIFNTKIIRKRKIYGRWRKSSKILNIIPLNEEREMVDIQTTSGNFIANGFIAHNCYAKKMAIRFGRKTKDTWKNMELNEKALNKKYKKRKGRIMFPTSHDITVESLNNCIIVLEKLLKARNEVLITTKPDLNCIKYICDYLDHFKEQIQFRFTITSFRSKTLDKWEPNAPGFLERMDSLSYAYSLGFKTSVSIEPFLDENPITLIKIVAPYCTESIWLGKLNYMKTKFNSYYNIKKIVGQLKFLPEEIKSKIRLKDSIQNLLKCGLYIK